MSTAAPKVSSKHTQKYRNLIALIKGKKRVYILRKDKQNQTWKQYISQKQVY